MLRTVIVDDEAPARSRLRTLLGDCQGFDVLIVGEAGNATEAMELVQRQDVDLVLLDIHMPGADGVQLASVLRELPQAPCIVFVTAHADYAVRAFELEAVDYLTKPVRLERLKGALEKVTRMAALQELAAGPPASECLVIAERGRTLRVPLAEVIYFKAELKYVTVRTARDSFLLDSSLSQLEEKFSDRFLRIHRNALVARKALRALLRHKAGDTVDESESDVWAVQVAGVQESLPVSRRQLASVREALGQ